MTRMLCLILCLAALAGCADTPARATTPRPVLLVSIDGYRADYIDRGLSPTLAALIATGVHATAMQPSFPSLTFPNHYTIVTGLLPDHHGIVNNTMADPTLGRFAMGKRDAVADGRWWDGGEPVWVTAQQHGLHTGTMFWPGTEAAIHGIRPDHWLPFDDKITPAERVDQILTWLDLPAAERPTFLTLYFDAVDHQGHLHGPDSPEVNQAIATTDAALARLVAGLKQRGLFERIDIVVVSDHGMAATPPDQVIYADDFVDAAQVDTVALGTLASFNPLPGHDFAASEKSLLAPHEHLQCWRKADIPARLHYGSNPRVPAVVCMPQSGWQITTHAAAAKRKDPLSLGQHGYDNADPLMRALFVAHGPSFRSGVTIGEFPNVDVYPLLMHLLNLPARPNDGTLAPLATTLTTR